MVGVYSELCSTRCGLPLDVIDQIIYEHSDIDTRVRVRAPPRRIPKRVLQASEALMAPVAAVRRAAMIDGRIKHVPPASEAQLAVIRHTNIGLRVILVFGEVIEEQPGTFWKPDSRKCYYIEINTSTHAMQVWDGLHIGILPAGSGQLKGVIWSNGWAP